MERFLRSLFGKRDRDEMNDWVAKLPEAISVPLLITGESNGEILYANSSFGTLAGVAAEDLIGKNVSELQTDHPGASSLVQMMGGHQSSRNMEIELSRGRKEQFKGRVVFVNPIVQAGNRYRVRAEVANRQEEGQWLLSPGSTATMVIHLQ